MSTPYVIDAVWNEEAQVWVGTCKQIPGLVTEAEDLDMLLEKATKIAPELWEAKGLEGKSGENPWMVIERKLGID